MGFQATGWGWVLVWLRIDPSVLCWEGENWLWNFKRHYKILTSLDTTGFFIRTMLHGFSNFWHLMVGILYFETLCYRKSAFREVKFLYGICNINTGWDRIISLEMLCILLPTALAWHSPRNYFWLIATLLFQALVLDGWATGTCLLGWNRSPFWSWWVLFENLVLGFAPVLLL